MSDVTITNRVTLRTDTGRFLDRYQTAKRRALERTLREGVATARTLAPKRTGRTANSIKFTMGTSGGTWSVNTAAGMYMEKGTRPHYITGWVNFWWAREGRRWHPGPNLIQHPGTRPVHFMERSYDAVVPKLIERMREEM